MNLLFLIMPVLAIKAMPEWLQMKTGLNRWPGDSVPPYIFEAHHNFSNIVDVARHNQGECDFDLEQACSFDCGHSTAVTDITTCDVLSQSFDDGPSKSTPALLTALKKDKMKTSFFLIGTNVVTHPDTVLRERREGHLVAVHTWSHQFLPALTNKEIFAELQWCIWAINATAGVVPRYFRPPYGGVDNRVRSIAKQLGLVTVLWDRDTDDWKLHIGERCEEDIMADVSSWTGQRSARWMTSRGLILEHDLEPVNIRLANKIRHKTRRQKTVAQCAMQPNYQRKYYH